MIPIRLRRLAIRKCMMMVQQHALTESTVLYSWATTMLGLSLCITSNPFCLHFVMPLLCSDMKGGWEEHVEVQIVPCSPRFLGLSCSLWNVADNSHVACFCPCGMCCSLSPRWMWWLVLLRISKFNDVQQHQQQHCFEQTQSNCFEFIHGLTGTLCESVWEEADDEVMFMVILTTVQKSFKNYYSNHSGLPHRDTVSYYFIIIIMIIWDSQWISHSVYLAMRA